MLIVQGYKHVKKIQKKLMNKNEVEIKTIFYQNMKNYIKIYFILILKP